MHDAFGRELKVGDTVMMPFKVKQIHSSEEYCNCDIESIATMPGNESHTSLSAVNTQQVIRANEGDETAFQVELKSSPPGVRLREAVKV